MIDRGFFGNTPLECIYDAAVILSLVEDGIGLDRSSEAYNSLHELTYSCWKCFDDVSFLSLSQGDD